MSGSIRESWNKHDNQGSSIRPSRTRDKSSIQYGSDDGEREVDPTEVVDKFRTVDAGKSDRYTAKLPALPLPGSGELRSDCGDDIPRFCSDCGHVHNVGRTCYRSRCPRCWKGWAKRRATTITSKLEALRRYREASHPGRWDGWKFHHLVLSPPDGYRLDSDDPMQRTMDLLKEVLGEIGVETGYVFYHPYRGEEGDDRGFWKSVLPDGESTDGKLKDTAPIEHSPHFHAVVLSKFVSTEGVVGHVEENTGWTIHRITKSDESDVSIYNDYDLARSVSYCLSHTGIGPDRVAYRSFGEVSNFVAEESIEREMDARVRSVGVMTLGLAHNSQSCSEDRVVPNHDEKVNLGAAHGAGGESDEVEEVEVERCDGRLLEIKAAPAKLSNPDWVRDAPHADELRDAWRSWRERIDDAPEPPRWDAPD